MLNTPQIERMLSKLQRFADNLEPHIFEKVGELADVEFCHVDRQYHSIPDLPFEKAEKGMKWAGEIIRPSLSRHLISASTPLILLESE